MRGDCARKPRFRRKGFDHGKPHIFLHQRAHLRQSGAAGVGRRALLNGTTTLERRAHFLAKFDWMRTGLMFEHRGHDMMSGTILYPPTRADCEAGVLFIETSGCLPMCGHGTIGTITFAIENGLIAPRVPGQLSIDTPAGKVDITYLQVGRFVEEVRLTNVPSFLFAEGLTAEIEGLGESVVNVACGRNFYAIVVPQKNFRDIANFSAGTFIRFSPKTARGFECEIRFSSPRTRRNRWPFAYSVDGQTHRPHSPRPQRCALWRQGD